MKINAGQASSTLIPEYIGSAFDKVVTVADNIGHIKEIAASIEGVVGSAYIGDTPPTQPTAGTIWYCTLDGRSYIWYEDTDSSQWVESSPQNGIADPKLAGNIFTLWKRSAAEAGYTLVAGSFEEGGVLNSSTDVLWHKELNSIYSWEGAYPHVVPPNTTPVGNTNYVSRTDIVPTTPTNAETESAKEALRRTYADAGLTVKGYTKDGATLTSTSDVVIHNISGKGYSWAGAFPKTVTPETDPTLDVSFVDMSGYLFLHSKLNHDIAYTPASNGYRLKNTVYATDYPFLAPTDGSDASVQINNALTYCSENNKNLVLDGMFTIEHTVNIPSDTQVICLTRACGLKSIAVGAEKAVVMSGSNSKFIGGTVIGINNPASTTVRQDGISMTSTSSFCEIRDARITGFFAKGFVGNGSGIAVADNGARNKVTLCNITDSKFLVSLRGNGGEISNNYISNRYLTQTVEAKPWTAGSNFWDGIVSEGISNYLIAYNTITECGQSGIYTGGNGGLSISNRIIGNTVTRNWNRGIDQGVNAELSVSNDVIGQLITSNICINNRENNIWLAGVSRCNVNGNTSEYNSDYATIFAGYYGGHTGIALTNGAAGAVPFGNSITSNNCYDSEGYSNISISCGLTATGNTIDGNTAPQGVYIVNNSLLATNSFNTLRVADWTPQLIGGTGTITLGTSTGRTTIRGRKANFTCVITIASVSSPSGHLTIGYVAPFSGVSFRYSDVRVSAFDGLDASIGSSQLIAVMGGISDQISVSRYANGVRTFDLRGYMKAGSTLTITGEVEFYA